MSYATYLRNKLDSQPKIMSLRKPEDASQHTHKKRLESTQIFFADGQGVGGLERTTTRSDGTPLLSHPAVSFSKATTRPADASTYTAYRGHIGVGDDHKFRTGGKQVVNAPIPVYSSPQFDTRGYGIANAGSFWVAVGADSNGHTIKYSDDNGVTWRNAESGAFPVEGHGVATDGSGNWVAVGVPPVGTYKSILYSTDGKNWSSVLSSQFSVSGWGVATDGITWALVGDDSATANNTIKIATSFANLTSGTFFNPPSSRKFGVAGYGVATDGASWYFVGANGDNSPYQLDRSAIYVSNANITSPTASNWYWVTGGFDTSGRGVTHDSSGNWIFVGEDSGGKTIKFLSNGNASDFSLESYNGDINGGAFATAGYGVSILNSSLYVMVGDDSPNPNTIKIATSYYNLTEGILTSSPSGMFTDMGRGVAHNGSKWIAVGDDARTVITSSSPSTSWVTVDPVQIGILCPVPIPEVDGSKYKTAADITRDKLACDKTNALRDPPLFVDNTIRLSAMVPDMIEGACAITTSGPSTHTHSPGLPIGAKRQDFAVTQHTFMAAPPEFQNKGVGGARIGAYYNPRSGYVENKHGNDLKVNPRRVPTRWVYTPGAPAHLKINNPTFANVKPV